MRNKHEVIIDKEKCIACGICIKDCPVNNIEIKEEKAEITGNLCLMCGHCASVCPKNAVVITGFDDAPEIVEDTDALNPDELLQAIKARRSIRQFVNTPVECEKLNMVIEAGRYTATGGNAQGVSYVLITRDVKAVEKKAVAFFRSLKNFGGFFNKTLRSFVIDDHFFFKGAPAVIAVISSNKIDGALAASNMELMAQAQGLGVLYSGLFTITTKLSRKVRKATGLKKGEKVVTTLVIGYPNVKYFRTAQKERALVKEI